MSKEKDELAQVIRSRYLAEIYTDKPHGLSDGDIGNIAEAVLDYIRKVGEEIKTKYQSSILREAYAQSIDDLINAIEKGEV